MKLALVIVLFSVSCQLSLSELYKDEQDDWKTDHYKLFGNDNGERLTPEETLETLKRLDRLYQGRTGEGEIKRHNLVKKLIRMAEPLSSPEDQCSHKIMREYQEVKFMAFSKHNIHPFIQHYRELRFLECRDQLSKLELAKKAAVMDEERMSHIESLTSKLGQAKSEFDSIKDDILPMLIAIKRFMIENAYSRKSLKDWGKFRKEVDQLLHGPCVMYRKNLGPMLIIYKDFEVALKAKMNETSQLLSHYDSVCISLTYGYISLVKGAFKIGV